MDIETICNQVLDRLGRKRNIGSIWEGTDDARIFLDMWGTTRDELLMLRKPQWAIKDAVLTVTKTAPFGGYSLVQPWSASYPPFPWLYEYQFPADGIYPEQVKSVTLGIPVWRPRPIPFRYFTDGEQQTILTNEANAILAYVYVVLDPNLWSPEFRELMVQALVQKFPHPEAQQRERQPNAPSDNPR